MLYLWDLTEASVFTHFNIKFLIILYQTHGPVRNFSGALSLGQKILWISSWQRKFLLSHHVHIHLCRRNPKIAQSQLSPSLFSSARSEFYSDQLLEKIEVLWVVVSGFNLTWECLRHVVLVQVLFGLHSQIEKMQNHLIVFIIYYVFLLLISSSELFFKQKLQSSALLNAGSGCFPVSITTPFSSSCRWDSHYSCDGGPVLPPSHSIYYYCSVHVEVRAALMLASLVWQKQFLNEQEWAFCAASRAKGWHSWCFQKKPARTMNENDVWGYLVNGACSFLCKAAPPCGEFLFILSKCHV